jgi:mycoredoxin
MTAAAWMERSVLPRYSRDDQEGLATVWGYTGVARTSTAVTLYWRPGCPYCWRLRTRLKLAGVHVDEINIWEDPAGAAFVRSVTGGDETVPTVRIGTRSLVNPSPRELLEMIRETPSKTDPPP